MVRSGQAPDDGLRRITVHVARPAAVRQLTGAVEPSLQSLRVRSGSEILEMTSCAGARICGRRVGHLFGIGGVTRDAAQGRTMLARIGSRHMLECDQVPVRRNMAAHAIARCRHVIRRLADGPCVIVAIRARAGDGSVIEHYRHPSESAVAAIALLRRRDVSPRLAHCMY